jgi:hypothetical protein
MLSVDENRELLLTGPDGSVQHMLNVPREKALQCWIQLADGKIDELRALPWQPGYPPRDLAEMARAREEAKVWQREYDRAFYDRLGPESRWKRCQAEGCKRGRVAMSVFCRQHQFENVRKRPCPFDD